MCSPNSLALREREHIEQQQQILLHEIHIKVSFFYLTPLSESSMVLHTILLYTIYIGEFGSRWLLFIEAKLQQKRNNNAPPLVCSSAAHSSKQASKAAVRPSVRAYSAQTKAIFDGHDVDSGENRSPSVGSSHSKFLTMVCGNANANWGSSANNRRRFSCDQTYTYVFTTKV